MNKAYLLLGGNLGDRRQNLDKAIAFLEETCGKVSKHSSIYETAAWGKTDQPSFLNQAVEIETELNSRQLMRKILKVEKMMGRTRKEKFDPRIIDIDILFFNDEICNYSFLKLPHPEVQNRRFALAPLAEITNLMHPVLKKTISELLQECRDELEVKKMSNE
jgi:2-amino-4-hydroxy-6-hydroxymethyldihydropteridine diphosphokinase